MSGEGESVGKWKKVMSLGEKVNVLNRVAKGASASAVGMNHLVEK